MKVQVTFTVDVDFIAGERPGRREVERAIAQAMTNALWRESADGFEHDLSDRIRIVADNAVVAKVVESSSRMLPFVGTVGFGLVEVFNIPWKASSREEAKRLFESPEGGLKSRIEAIMRRKGVDPEASGWHNDEVLEVTAVEEG